MNISIIAAIDQQYVIGKDNALLWHLPGDLQFFRKKTTGHTIIMGRNTFESIGGGKPLPHRTTIIITRNTSYQAPEGCFVAHSLQEALALVKADTEVFICGGAQIYALAFPIATHMYLTRIHHRFEGDTYFPQFATTDWNLIESVAYQADEKNAYAYTIETYCKITV